MRTLFALLRGFGLFALLVGLLAPLSVSTTAQGDSSGQYAVVVISSICDASPNETVDFTCEALPGATILFTSEGGSVIGSCVTELTTYQGAPSASCSFPVNYGVTVIVSQDPTTVPDGYVLTQNNVLFIAPDADSGSTGGSAAGNVGIFSVLDQVPSRNPSSPESIPDGFINTYLCDTDPGPRAPATDRPFPSDCEAVEGVQVVASLEDGTVLDSCTTAAGACDFQSLPYCPDYSLVFTEDVTTIPDEYEPRENPILAGNCTEYRGVTFYNVATNAAVSASPAGSATEVTAETDGSTAAIYGGDCDSDFTDEPVATLTNVRPPDGDAQGAEGASAVETSVTTLDLPLDDILAEDHVLVVFDEDDDTVPLVCGPIGGIVTDDGSLALGLPLVGESRYSGIAYLTPDGDRTGVTVFLAENLSGAEETPEA